MCAATAAQTTNFVSEWLALLKQEENEFNISTLKGSVLYVKRVIAIMISAMLFKRRVFPESEFGDRQLAGQALKILSLHTGNSAVKDFMELLKSSCEALDTGYIQQIRFMFLSEEEKPIEEYAFKFTYTEDGFVSFVCEDELSGPDSVPETTHRTTLETLNKMLHIRDMLNPLPEKGRILITLLYNDDRTPPNYQPSGFQALDFTTYPTIENSFNIKMGDIVAPQLNARVVMKTVLLNRDIDVLTVDGGDDELQVCENGEMDHGKGSIQLLPSDENEEENLQNLEVRCPCNIKVIDHIMLSCCVCRKKQHGMCFGVIFEDDVPDRHVCELCHAAAPSIPISPTEVYLYSVNQRGKNFLCLIRRALVLCAEYEKEVTVDTFVKCLHVKKRHAQALIKFFEGEGYIERANAGGDRVVNREVLLCVGFKKYLPSVYPRMLSMSFETDSLCQDTENLESIDPMIAAEKLEGKDNGTKNGDENSSEKMKRKQKSPSKDVQKPSCSRKRKTPPESVSHSKVARRKASINCMEMVYGTDAQHSSTV